MVIAEMHQYFRVLCQKMGMQLVNVILPEEIDVFLNLSIIEKVRTILNENSTSVFQDKVTLRDNPISVVNSLRNLYHEDILKEVDNNTFDLSSIDAMDYISFAIVYSDKVYKCRLIVPEKLEDTLNDYCNGASIDYPICSIFNYDGRYVCQTYGSDKEHMLKVKYIKYPNKVSFKGDVSCDLLEQYHGEIVQQAVNKYFVSNGLSNQVNNK